jgi:hypothetical protein
MNTIFPSILEKYGRVLEASLGKTFVGQEEVIVSVDCALVRMNFYLDLVRDVGQAMQALEKLLKHGSGKAKVPMERDAFVHLSQMSALRLQPAGQEVEEQNDGKGKGSHSSLA